ncbi:MAG TPA: selenide, water dikinase SelD [Chthoniobacterales bacterium]|nr:selenide, water dikinase SelD [Chthoniobacterales bacterium]
MLKLTSLSSCAGCAAKLPQQALTEVLRSLPQFRDPRLLVGSSTADDAGVYRIDRDRALVQTVDFFTPIVDDPFSYGQIAATNAISDVYAMGGRPLTALNLVGVPADKIRPKTIRQILCGGLMKAKEAKCVVLGGHTIRSPEPIYGMAVTGLVSPKKMLTNATARPGDLLVLTKPLGTGVVTTGIKRGVASTTIARRAIGLMSRLNSVGAALAESGLVRAAVDITGFGLLGHLASMCRASEVSAEIYPAQVPAIAREIFSLIEQHCIPGGSLQNLETADKEVRWNGTKEALRILLTDAQTSGGLLLCVNEKSLTKVLGVLRKARTPSLAIVGNIVRRRSDLILCTTK